jgi:hypothetical protein
MATAVSQNVYNQIIALRDGLLQQATSERAQATALAAQADQHQAESQDYVEMLATLEVGP